jgi:DNA processing protein
VGTGFSARPSSASAAAPRAATPDRRIARAEQDFPVVLLDLADPPREVYVRGSLPAGARTVAIVGSRAATAYGLARAERLAADLARLSVVIVSGLARGIDAAAHRGALAAGGHTVAVIPSGLDAITPHHHAALAEAIVERGALVSERPSGPPFGKGAFLHRNRLIAALASATVVVEAASRSGALNTAEWARGLGRSVLAVPGPVDRETARGCHRLIRGGAALCEDAGDVLAAIGSPARAPLPSGAMARPASASVPPAVAHTPEARLLAALGRDALTVDDLARAAGLALPEALAALTALRWAGAAVSHPGQRWSRAT